MYPNRRELFNEIYDLIKEEYCHQVVESIPGGSAAAHKAVLTRFSRQWKKLDSSKTCLAYLARGAEKSLSCRHSLCKTCVIRDGRKDPYDPWDFMLDKCPLCQRQNTIMFSIKPYTAGIRGLSIEGDLGEDSIERILEAL